MNKDILNLDIQEYIKNNINSDVTELLLKGSPFDYIDDKVLIAQIESKRRCQDKLPTWFNSKDIYYPNKLNIEQSSSEITGKFKASLIDGESLLDLTGGFGVDSYFFSEHFGRVIHCEMDSELSDIAAHNFRRLGAININCLGIENNHCRSLVETYFNYL